MSRRRSIFRYRLRTALFALLVAAALLATGRAISKSEWWNGGVRPTPFETDAWRRADDIDNYRTVRSQMVNDLLRKYDFHGWSRSSLFELLGEPEWDPKTAGFPNWDIAYHLGLERGGSFSLDDEFLLFRFDSHDRVIDYGTGVN